MVLLAGLILVQGCTEGELLAGVFGGVGSAKITSDQMQERFVKILNEFEVEVERLQTQKDTLSEIEIKKETKETIKKAKDRTKDPVTWIALLSVLANSWWGGRASTKLGSKPK